MKINTIGSAQNPFKGAYAIRGTDEEVQEFNEHFYKDMKSKGHRGRYAMYYFGPRISPDQPQCDLFIATDKDRDTLNDFLYRDRRDDESGLQQHEPPPDDAQSEDFSYWYFKQTDKSLKKLRQKFGLPIQIISARSALRAIDKGAFNFTTGEIER